MSTDTELEHLLRRTLTLHADDVRHAAPPSGTPRRSARPAILGALAAVAVTALTVAAAAVFAGGDGGGPSPAAGAVRTTCTAKPGSAEAVLAAGSEVTYQGRRVDPDATTPGGTVLGQVGIGSNAEKLVAVGPGGQGRLLLTTPAGRMITRVDADDAHAVVTSSPNVSGVGDSALPLDRIVVVDLSTRATRSVLTELPVGYPRHPIGSRGAVLQDGVVYWSAATTSDATAGDVLSYDITTRRYADLGPTRSVEVDRDSRGVGWPGGSVPAADVPQGLPTFFDTEDRYQPVFSDGRTTAWQDEQSQLVHVRDEAGMTSTWEVPTSHGGRTALAGVSGSLLAFSDVTGDVRLLDIRTGAVAALDIGLNVAYPSFVSPSGLVLSRDDDRAAVRLNTSEVPELHC